MLTDIFVRWVKGTAERGGSGSYPAIKAAAERFNKKRKGGELVKENQAVQTTDRPKGRDR